MSLLNDSTPMPPPPPLAQAAEAARADVERVRRALIDAEIEMQRGVNDTAALRQRLQVRMLCCR